jgi:UDP-N-acetylglucosamine 2-epimerase (non-hydrolysing)
VVVVAGARPNFVKVGPVLASLEARGADTVLVHTGQHHDAALSDVFFNEIGIRAPDHDLGVGSGSHAEQTARVMVRFEPLVERLRPDLVVVVGDVNSTVAAALVAAKAGVRLAHVEAGLRSGDRSMPEEINRVVTDGISDVLLAPSEDARANLDAEGRPASSVHVVGNVMVDTLLANLHRARGRGIAARLGLAPAYGVVTLHRPANVDDPVVLDGLIRALAEIARDLSLVLPAHPRLRRALGRVEVPNGVLVTAPLGYLDFVGLLDGARLAITDSGGVQEETSVLGIPCLTARDNTERPITVTLGTNRIVGRDPRRIVAAARDTLAAGPPPPARIPLWDGVAAPRIAEILVPA